MIPDAYDCLRASFGAPCLWFGFATPASRPTDMSCTVVRSAGELILLFTDCLQAFTPCAVDLEVSDVKRMAGYRVKLTSADTGVGRPTVWNILLLGSAVDQAQG